MASDKDEAKGAILSRSEEDPALSDTLAGAHDLQLELARESDRHQEAMRGWFGRIIGDERNAPVIIAFIAMMVGLGVWVYCLTAAAGSGQAVSDFWSRSAERALGFALSALTFIFGKGLAKSQ